MNEKIKLHKFTCKRCGHTWIPRKPKKPKVCPKCSNPYWDKEYSRPDLIKKEKE